MKVHGFKHAGTVTWLKKMDVWDKIASVCARGERLDRQKEHMWMDKRDFGSRSGSRGAPLLMSEPWEVHEWEELVQEVSGQYLPSWRLPDVWVELPIFDASTGEWGICSGSCVESGMALVRCGNLVRAVCRMAWPKKRTRLSAPGRMLE